MKGTLAQRVLIWVGVPMTLVFGLIIGLSSTRSFRRVVEHTEMQTRALARFHAARIEGEMKHASNIPEMIALEMERGYITETEELESYLREVLTRHPEIYGSCIAFKPFGFRNDLRGYAPYFYWKGDEVEFVQLANPDYNYFQWEWYRRPRDLGRAVWTEPYFDEGGGNVIMISYSVPFRREGQFWGIATCDIAMPQFIAETEKIRVGESGYAFIVSRGGQYLAHPDRSKVLNSAVEEMNPELAERLMNGMDGFMRTTEPMHGKSAWVAYAPVLGGDLSLAIVFPNDEALAEAYRSQAEQILIGVVAIGALLGALAVVGRSIGKPVAQLAEAAHHVASGNLHHKLDATDATAEVRHLTHAFNKMTRDLQMRMEELRYTTTVKERLEGELGAARSIQMSLLPKRFPAFPDRKEFDIHAIVRPAREVGGDFYDFFLLDKERLCVVIGDVSGKGTPASLYMAVSTTLVRAYAGPTVTPSEVLSKVNYELCQEDEAGMFVTVLCAYLHLETGELVYCNAGHLAPRVIAKDGAEVRLLPGRSPALGMLVGLEYSTHRARLNPDETLFLTTDGVTEALSDRREFFGSERLDEAIRGETGGPLSRMTGAVVSRVQEFAGASEQTDDISVLAVRWHGARSSVARIETKTESITVAS